MIHLSFRYINPDEVGNLRSWLQGINEERRSEAIATLVAEEIRHEAATLLETAEGTILAYAVECGDVDQAMEVARKSNALIDAEHQKVMRAAAGRRVTAEKLLNLSV